MLNELFAKIQIKNWNKMLIISELDWKQNQVEIDRVFFVPTISHSIVSPLISYLKTYLNMYSDTIICV